MTLCSGIAIDLCSMVEHLDADFDRTRTTFSDSRLQIHKQIFGPRDIEFAKLLHFQSWLPSDGFPECLMAGLPSDRIVRRKCNALWDRNQSLRLPATNPADLFRDGVEGKTHSLQMDGLSFDPSSS